MRPSQDILTRRYEFREQHVQVICSDLNSRQKVSIFKQGKFKLMGKKSHIIILAFKIGILAIL